MEENNTAFRRSNSRLSMLEKSLERRRVNKEHNSNFRAGYVAVHEDHLHKTGLRGRKRFLAYLLLFLIYAVAVANLVLTVLIMLVLRIDQNGSGVIEFLTGSGIRYKDSVEAERVLSDVGEFGGFRGQDLNIHGDAQPVKLQHMSKGASVEISGGNTTLRGQDGLHVFNPLTGNTVLHTSNDTGIHTPTGMRELATTQVVTHKVTPIIGDSLLLESDRSVTIQGNEGLSINARHIDLSATNINLVSHSAMSLESGPAGGIYLNTTLLPKKSTGTLNGSVTGYALCVCANTGQVFKVVAARNVQHPCGNLQVNPCG